MQTITIDRKDYRVYLDDEFLCFGLENQQKLIALGTFKTVLTLSGRAKAGTLWTPWEGFMLPELLLVPNRTAIRIHGANEEHQLEGCIAFGMDRLDGKLLRSRQAVNLYKDRIQFPHWTEVV